MGNDSSSGCNNGAIFSDTVGYNTSGWSGGPPGQGGSWGGSGGGGGGWGGFEGSTASSPTSSAPAPSSSSSSSSSSAPAPAPACVSIEPTRSAAEIAMDIGTLNRTGCSLGMAQSNTDHTLSGGSTGISLGSETGRIASSVEASFKGGAAGTGAVVTPAAPSGSTTTVSVTKTEDDYKDEWSDIISELKKSHDMTAALAGKLTASSLFQKSVKPMIQDYNKSKRERSADERLTREVINQIPAYGSLVVLVSEVCEALCHSDGAVQQANIDRFRDKAIHAGVPDEVINQMIDDKFN